MKSPGLKALALLAMSILGALLPARSARADVRDHAGFFDPAIVQRANATIADLHSRLGKDLIVETFPAIPDDMKAKYSEAKKDQIFVQWNAQRGHELGIDGVYALICKSPAYIDVNAN